MFNFRNNKLGMTLVEMVVSLIVLSILTTSTMGIIISSNNIFVSSSSAALDRQVGGHVFETLSSIIKYSTHMDIYDSTNAPSNETAQSISLKDIDSSTNSGKIYFKHADSTEAVNLYDNGFYGTRTVQYIIQSYDEGNRHVKLTVRVYRDSKMRYELSRVIKCINLGLNATGDEANFINDNSTEGSINQYISFSINENLIDGATEAYSLEYKVTEYMARYNQIQMEYTSKIQQVYAEVNSVIGNTEDTEGSRVSQEDFKKVLNMRSTAILGKKYNFNTDKDGAGESVNGVKWDGSVYDYINLRKHYQDEINELLHFTPTAGITKSTDINPFYGVVATKEELYTGFLLEYYSENDKHEKVTKATYPSFSDDSFFDGSSIGTYLANTNKNKSANDKNKMVILSYFGENTRENYDELWISTGKKYVYTYAGGEIPGAVGFGWVCNSDINNQPGAYGISVSSINSGEAVINGPYDGKGYCFSVDTTYHLSKVNPYRWFYSKTGEFEGMPLYNKHTQRSYEKADNARKELGDSSAVDFRKDTDSGLTNLNKLTSKATQITNDNKNYIVRKQDNTYCIVPLVDMKTGWYYYVDGDIYHFFYLFENAAFKDSNPDHIAVGKVRGSDTSVNRSRILIGYKQCDSERSASYKYNEINGTAINFAQASIGMVQPDTGITESAEFFNITAHQYNDYILYATDWNTWFSDTTKKGILNELTQDISNFANKILGRTVNTKITEISGTNALQSLGNRGQANLEKIDSDIASYNMAWAVYSPKRCTWYYIPESSDRLSSALSSISWSDFNDAPTPIDVELASGETWTSSTAMVGNIEQKKLNSSGLFGIDTTSSIMWCSLPVSAGKVDTSSLVK